MSLVRLAVLAAACAVASGAARADAPPFGNCPLTGVMPDYAAEQPPAWKNWDQQTVRIGPADNETDMDLRGAICTQSYGEKEGHDQGSILEIMENYKAALAQLGFEIKHDVPGNVVGELVKDGQDRWIAVGATRDDGYTINEVIVAPFKRSILPPSGNDYRLIGHMPGFVAGTPTRRNYDQYEFPTEGGGVVVKGALYSVTYDDPPTKPEREITPMEVVANQRAALHDLNAEILRDDPENVTARLDDHGKSIWIFADRARVVALEEKPFQLTIQPPTADTMKDQLDKEGHIALYVNFDFARATLKPDAAPIIAQVVALLKRNPDLKVSIEGHTDGVGEHDYNMKLSQDRAASVLAAITASGIEAERLASAGFGPDKPVAPNDTDAGRARNRRVELVKSPS